MKKVKFLLLGMLLMPFLVNAQKHHLQKSSYQSKNLITPAKNKLDTSMTRGLTYYEFTMSVPEFKNKKKLYLRDTAWALWQNRNWKKLEELFNTDTLNYTWPPNNGAISKEIEIVLPAGWLIDRYGGKFEANIFKDATGDFVAPQGTAFYQRSLPDTKQDDPYTVYIVVEDIQKVKLGQSIPWKNQAGLGVQFKLPYSIDSLKRRFIKEIKQSTTKLNKL